MIPSIPPDELKSRIKENLAELGFSATGIARAEPLVREKEFLLAWLQQKMHGTMHWMEQNTEMRINPNLLLPGAKSIIIVLVNYFPHRIQGSAETPIISKYAYGKDYHKVIRKKLKRFAVELSRWIPDTRTKVFVDSAPVMERVWAVRAGLGWQGKNSLLINKEFGSFVFLGGIITTAEIEPDPPSSKNLCGKCTRCIEACPTKAIVKPGIVDARKCISYLTIEYRGEIPENLRSQMQGRIFGCDICQDVCPWNRKHIPTAISEFEPSPLLFELDKNSFRNLTDDLYQRIFRGTPVDRIGAERLRKNICPG